MKRILGLDLGTNSIGSALVEGVVTDSGKYELSNIRYCGSRVIPMDAAKLGDFERGNSVSQTADRTKYRSTRHLYERSKLRRERLHRVLDLMGFLPAHYSNSLTRYGKFRDDVECKLPWVKDDTGVYHFLFKESFQEMLVDFSKHQPQLVCDGKKVPYDWTIYYLRKKALSEKITKEELAWVLLNFNQKRGYYQLREEESDDRSDNKSEEYHSLKVVKVEALDEKKGKATKYNVEFENGMIWSRFSNVPLDWEGKIKDIIVTTTLDKDGNPKKNKEGEIIRSFRNPDENDWSLLKIRTENEIKKSQETVGAYIYDTLLRNMHQKIRGKLVHTIERKFYKEELHKILESQKRFHEELNDRQLFLNCLEELYPNNEGHRNVRSGKGLAEFLVDDILFYQRPLKSKKSLISDCPYEFHTCIDKATGEKKRVGIKCISSSHPLFQEFRLWQFVSNLRIYQKEKRVNGKLEQDVDVTSEFIKSDEDKALLFEWLNDKRNINQKAFLKYKGFGLGKHAEEYRWNYVEDDTKKYPCNDTRALLLDYLAKANVPSSFLTKEKELALWHLLYSIEDNQELEKALSTFSQREGLNEEAFVEVFKKFPAFKKDYGAYSAKAISKLLSLMRCGKYWSEDAIDENTRLRIQRIIDGECDDSIRNRVREKTMHLTDISCFKSLPLWLACYVVYDRHSEAKEITKWNSPEDIDKYLYEFKQHSLRNPIVEQVLTETLRVVRDVWKQYGTIDEIHIELGREMNATADKKKKWSEQSIKNENTNLRVKALLMDFMNPEFEVENVRPYSPSQQELLRIYEDGVFDSVGDDVPEDISGILKKFAQADVNKKPSRTEVLRYKLWLDQKYVSPYTGEPIPLGKLFTSAYEIEHVIPQSLYFDDSFNNKVICEAEVNKRKSNQLGYEFIKNHHGEKIELSFGKAVTVLSVEGYEQLLKNCFSHNHAKRRNLLLEDVPEKFIQRQMNDTRYISREIMRLLSNIVRDEDEQESKSKHVIPCNGGITDYLKKDWGLNDVWNSIILPRFERLNRLTGKEQFTSRNTNNKLIPDMPLDLQKGFKKKRIDHRHHAMDAIVIACANINIINYLNNSSACHDAKASRYDLRKLLCHKCKSDADGNSHWVIDKPWPTFTQDVHEAILQIVVSFKQNLRVINRTTNYYQHYDSEGKKEFVPQTNGDSWAIRKPLHKETVYGEVNLRKVKEVSLAEAIKSVQNVQNKDLKKRLSLMLHQGYDLKQMKRYFEDNKDVWQDINLSKIEIYYFTQNTNDRYFTSRASVDTSFNRKKIEEKITDTGIQKIMIRHLESKGENPELAFSPEGIDEMNKNIIALNDGAFHHPIYKVRVYEKAEKFAVGKKGNKGSKFVEAAKGTNLFFAIYEEEKTDDKTGEVKRVRSYATIPLNVAIERQKQGLSSVPDEDGIPAKYVLSPNDLVYVPTQDELEKGIVTSNLDKDRIYKMVSCTGNRSFFIKVNVAKSIVDKFEFSPLNKMERALSSEMIKEICVPLKVDRLGNISID